MFVPTPYCFLLLAILFPAAAHAATFSATAVSSLTKVPRTGEVAGARALALEAARGEFEHGQVVVRAHRAPIAKLSARASELTGPDGARLPPPRLYRVGYIDITRPSNIEGRTGLWPDPLIPDIDAYLGERRNAFPVAVPVGANQPIWIELYVPPRSPAGRYAGAITLTADGQTRTVPLELHVHPFTLPTTPTLPVLVGLSGLSISRAHRGRYVSDDDNRALTRLYLLALLRHRTSAFGGTMLPPDHRYAKGGVEIDWSRYDEEVGPFLDGTADPELPGARMQLVDLRLPSRRKDPEERAALTRAWAAHFRDRGWRDRLFDYTFDEPKEEQIPEVKARAELIGRAGIPRLVTTPLDRRLDGLVDLYTPLLNHIDDKPERDGGSPRAVPRGAYGDRRVFWYQSCMSHGCDIIGGAYFTGWPQMVVDVRSAVAHRIQQWMTFRYGVQGELYYNSTEIFGQKDPWQTIHAHGGNGDGTLFYPGTPSRIGGRSDIPIESIRLKLLRDGIEDYEYLRMAGRAADPIVKEIVRRTFDFTADPRALLRARHRLAERITATRVVMAK